MHVSKLQAGGAGRAPLPTALSATAGPRTCSAAQQRTCSATQAHAPQTQPTPLLDAVAERGGRSGEVPFHVPGHKRGASMTPHLQHLLGNALQYDLTELEGLDILSTPSGPILAAQQLAAASWGADATWFLVNGTTAGIHAAVMATCGPRDALVLARNAHLSAFNAMVLAGCTPVYLQPCYDARLGIAHHVTPAALQAAFEVAERAGLRVGAALVVSPTYFGVLSDVAGLAAVCHAHGVPLLVDEAHGAHLGLHPGLPPSALQSGADLTVQSTHKQLSAMTQAAMLHVRGGRVQRERLSRSLQVLQSSSPSYLLMSSLDAARAQASQPAAHEEALAAAALAKQQLQHLPGVQLLSLEQVAASSSSGGSSSSSSGGSNIGLDPLRLTISLQQLGLTGYQAAAALEQQHGIVAELATPACVVLAMSIGSTQQHVQALVAALQQMCKQYGDGGSNGKASSSSSDPPSPASLEASPAVQLSPRSAFFAAAEAVPAGQAVGRVSAELLCPYPPGVPAAHPGEVLTAEVVQQLQAVLKQGGTITGCRDSSLQTLLVVVGA